MPDLPFRLVRHNYGKRYSRQEPEEPEAAPGMVVRQVKYEAIRAKCLTCGHTWFDPPNHRAPQQHARHNGHHVVAYITKRYEWNKPTDPPEGREVKI